MRKRYRIFLIAAAVAALVVPVGYALSLESQPPATMFVRTNLATATSATIVAAPVMLHQTRTSVTGEATELSPLHAVPDAGKLFLVGTLLFGLSVIVRKAI